MRTIMNIRAAKPSIPVTLAVVLFSAAACSTNSLRALNDSGTKTATGTKFDAHHAEAAMPDGSVVNRLDAILSIDFGSYRVEAEAADGPVEVDFSTTDGPVDKVDDSTSLADSVSDKTDATTTDRPIDKSPDAISPGVCGGDYVSCGCECCGGATGLPKHCYYPGAGESIETVIAADLATKNATHCSLAGCSLGVQYTCCQDKSPTSGAGLSYSAGYGPTYGGEIYLMRTGPTSDFCSIVLVHSPEQSQSGYQVELPAGWGVETGGSYFKAWGPVRGNAIGARGAIAIRAVGTECVLDAHLTLFSELLGYGSNAGSVRLDVDGLVINYAPASLCGAQEPSPDAGIADGGLGEGAGSSSTCTTVDSGVAGGSPFYCIPHLPRADSNTPCTAMGPPAICENGTWTCPSGSMPSTQCGCFIDHDMPRWCTQPVCNNHQWTCDIDAG